MVAVEGEQGDALLNVGLLFLHLPDGADSVVEALESLLADVAHAAALVHDNQIENLLFHSSCVLVYYYFERKKKGKY